MPNVRLPDISEKRGTVESFILRWLINVCLSEDGHCAVRGNRVNLL
jgi:hypothetical protein